MSSPMPARSEQDLTDDERHQLEVAHRELRASVQTYEAFLGRELKPGVEAPVVDAEELRAAQERVEVAERTLWDLRERLLGWSRPSWAPPATLVSDWILEEDPGYDDEPAPTPRR